MIKKKIDDSWIDDIIFEHKKQLEDIKKGRNDFPKESSENDYIKKTNNILNNIERKEKKQDSSEANNSNENYINDIILRYKDKEEVVKPSAKIKRSNRSISNISDNPKENEPPQYHSKLNIIKLNENQNLPKEKINNLTSEVMTQSFGNKDTNFNFIYNNKNPFRENFTENFNNRDEIDITEINGPQITNNNFKNFDRSEGDINYLIEKHMNEDYRDHKNFRNFRTRN